MARAIYYNKRFQRRMRQNHIFCVVRDTEPIESVDIFNFIFISF